MERIPIAGPWITEREVQYVADAAANGWYGQANAYQDRFERAFAEYLGVKFAVSLPSCTSAIHLALAALGMRPKRRAGRAMMFPGAASGPVETLRLAFIATDARPGCLMLQVQNNRKSDTHSTPINKG